MDIVTHAATGILLSTAFENPTAKTLCIIGSVIPDIMMAPIYAKAYATAKSFTGTIDNFKRSSDVTSPIPQKFYIPYWLAHSLLPIAVFTIIAFFSKNTILLAFAAGYLSHLAWDIPTHTKMYACRPFYPFSDFKWDGFGDWWENRFGLRTIVATWLVLGTAYFFVT